MNLINDYLTVTDTPSVKHTAFSFTVTVVFYISLNYAILRKSSKSQFLSWKQNITSMYESIPFYFALGMERSGTTNLQSVNCQENCKEPTDWMHSAPKCLGKVQSGLNTHVNNKSSDWETQKDK